MIDKFTATGEYVGQITAKTVAAPEGFFFGLHGVAVDPRGEVWVAEEHKIEGKRVFRADKFSDSVANEFQGFATVSNFLVPGLAVSFEDNLYTDTGGGLGVFESNTKGELLGEGAAVGGESATVVARNGFTTEASNGDVYINNAGSVVRFGPFIPSGPAEIRGYSRLLPRSRTLWQG